MGSVVPFSLKIPSLSLEKLGIISGMPQRLTFPVSAGRYNTCQEPTWKCEIRQISGITPTTVFPDLRTRSRGIGKFIKSAIDNYPSIQLILPFAEASRRYCMHN